MYWSMVRDLLDEALSFAVALRAAPYEALDERGRALMLDAVAQLVESTTCVLDAVQISFAKQGENIVLHPGLQRLLSTSEEAREIMLDQRDGIQRLYETAPQWELADAVADARVETVRALETLADCWGAPRRTRRRFRTYWDEQAHYGALASRASRRLIRHLGELAPLPIAQRIEHAEALITEHARSFEFGLLRQEHRRLIHNLQHQIAARGTDHDDLRLRRLWLAMMDVARDVADDQAARAS
jgi:hypothetical protein